MLGMFKELTKSARLVLPQNCRNLTRGFSSLSFFRTSSETFVPTRIPALLYSVENTLGSGLPSGVRFPVSRLSPFKLSSHSRSNSPRKRSRITTKDGSERYEKLEIRHMTPRPVCSAIRLSAIRKKRMYRQSRLNFLIPHFLISPSL